MQVESFIKAQRSVGKTYLVTGDPEPRKSYQALFVTRYSPMWVRVARLGRPEFERTVLVENLELA